MSAQPAATHVETHPADARPHWPTDGDAGLELYIREVVRQPPLTIEEEDHLLDRLRGGDADARRQFICRSLRLVVSIARCLAPDGPLLDLIECGNRALIESLEAYEQGDPALPFYAWAAERIRRAMAETA